jgi:hypothetical protein
MGRKGGQNRVSIFSAIICGQNAVAFFFATAFWPHLRGQESNNFLLATNIHSFFLYRPAKSIGLSLIFTEPAGIVKCRYTKKKDTGTKNKKFIQCD